MVDADSLARLALFADLDAGELGVVAAWLEEERHPRGTRVLREGLAGSGLYVVLDGEASIVVAGQERARLGPGDFFGEISALTGEPATADVVAAGAELHCAVLPGSELRPLLLRFPRVALRMLEVEARRLRRSNTWAG